MTSRQLPSPIALRAFEAAARHLSFTLAARELFVTQSAISHQVRGLEKSLGLRLFVRMTRQLQLTRSGERLLEVVRESYDRIEDTIVALRFDVGAGPLRVSLTSYLAARWLTRRLGQFAAIHPQVEIHLQLTNGDPDFHQKDLDLAIVWSLEPWSNVVCTELIPLNLVMVCSPSLMRSGRDIKEFQDLRHYTLLHESGRNLWEYYLRNVKAKNVIGKRNVVMDDPNVLHQACIEGQGIALGAEALLFDELQQGVLVRLFSDTVRYGSYYLLHRSESRNQPNVLAFQNWLVAEAVWA